ncbi:MAG: murB [Parachlamydiales bacterium]|nr:murB [Parachlamydiales bacterium]
MSIEERFRTGQSLKQLSTFGIGGPVRYYLAATQISEIEQAIQWSVSHQISYFILGKGSNCLFDDRGFNGVVIHNKIDFCTFNGREAHVGAGSSFARLGALSAKRGLSGLEFAVGIPGSVGGAIFMNAGAGGRETSQTVDEVLYLHESGEQKIYSRGDFQFANRYSSFQTMRGSILSARFVFDENPDARQTQSSHIDCRRATQPYREKSAGCIFRNPPQKSAGALIDQCGLKGLCVGGAKVSEIHANFIINASHATQADVMSLIEQIQQRVFQQTGIRLEPEVRLVPYE